MIIRPVQIEDSKELVEIYNYYISNTAFTFEYDELTADEFQSRIETISAKYPYFVAEENGEVLGYAYATSFYTRKAFMWDAEVAIYLKNSATTKGIGTAFYNKIIEILTKQNYVNLYSHITYPNEKSFALHEKFGFIECARYEKTGYKFDKWRDTVILHKLLVDIETPKEIINDWKQFI